MAFHNKKYESAIEAQLAAAINGTVSNDIPRSRIELQLARINGESVTVPSPQSRIEQLLEVFYNKESSGIRVKEPKMGYVVLDWDGFGYATEVQVYGKTPPADLFNKATNPQHGKLKIIRFMDGLVIVSQRICFNNDALTEVYLSSSVTTIGTSSFDGCSMPNFYAYENGEWKVGKLPAKLEVIGDYAFRGIGSEFLGLPDSIKSVGKSAFEDCAWLLGSLPKSLTSLSESAFKNCERLTITEIPSGITSIPTNVFYGCTATKVVTIPATVKTIADTAFGMCTGLTKVAFSGTPESIGVAFVGCSNITDIYVPWAEGVVENAPWGAASATIHYSN